MASVGDQNLSMEKRCERIACVLCAVFPEHELLVAVRKWLWRDVQPCQCPESKNLMKLLSVISVIRSNQWQREMCTGVQL